MENTKQSQYEADDYMKNIIINTEPELITFLLDILEYGENIESEEILLEDTSYKILYLLLKNILPLTVLVEEKYIDKIYRDSYYMHFSCKHGEYSRFCKRLFVFSGNIFEKLDCYNFCDLSTKKLQDNFVGTIVIRPLRGGKIGRCLLNPHFLLKDKNIYLRYARYSATVYGKRLQINAFPFSMQDGETTTCAEVTILNLMDYFGKKYCESRSILPSDIVSIVEKNDFERALPARGLKYATITKVFSEMGFYPRLYAKKLFADGSQFKRVMHYYIESGIPVAIGVKVDEKTKHSVVCIGHGEINYKDIGKKIYAIYDKEIGNYIWIVDSSDLCRNYIMMDDGHVPYEEMEWKVEKSHNINKSDKYILGDYEPEVLMVPLYKRMFLEAQDAYDISTSALASKDIGIQKFYPNIGSKEKPVIIRLFMCSSRNYKYQRMSNLSKKNEYLCKVYNKLRLPRFIWVCEIYDEKGYRGGKASGEIVIDATSSPDYGTKSILLFHYPYYVLMCHKNIVNVGMLFGNDEVFEKLDKWEPIDSYNHNLHLPENKMKNRHE